LSAALNALAVSFTRDWYQPAQKQLSDVTLVACARFFTCVFAVLMIAVASATSYFVIEHPESRIIPIVLGIFGYTYGSLLGVFLLGLLTKGRGSDSGNCLSMILGFLVVSLFSGSLNVVITKSFLQSLGIPNIHILDSWASLAFPWRIMLGTIVTFGVGLCFASPANTSKTFRDN
jgi:hypothetical protein